MTQTVGGGVAALRAAMAGPVIDATDPGYDAARAVWNGDIDRRPALIARCGSAEDVAAAVRYAQVEGLEIALQQMLDEGNAAGQHYYEKSTYVDDLTDGVADALADHLGRRTSPMSIVFIYRLDQAFCEADESDTAFGGTRSPQYAIFGIAASPTPDLLPADREWSRSLWTALQPHSRGVGTYVNAMTEYEERRVRAAYGDTKYERLKQIKAAYDERNVFHRNINIKPA